MRLIITEKEQQGAAIANALGEVEEYGDKVRYFQVNGDIVIIPAKGHLWNSTLRRKKNLYIGDNVREELPDFDIYFAENSNEKDRIELIKEMVKRDWDEVIIATDYDREGAIIGYEILQHGLVTDGHPKYSLADVKRVHLMSLEDTEIKEAFANLIPFSDDIGFIEAGYCRSVLDALWGLNLTAYLQTLYRKAVLKRLEDVLGSSTAAMELFKTLPLATISSGRVQSPTLNMILSNTKIPEMPSVEHQEDSKLADDKIRINVHAGGYIIPVAEMPISDMVDCEKWIPKFNNLKAKLIKIIEDSEEFDHRRTPFNTDKIIQLLSEQYGISPQRAGWLLETAYMGGYLTYPRTDSEKIPLEQEKMDERLEVLAEYYPVAREFIGEEPNEGEQEDEAHIAIIPTMNCTADKLEELKEGNPQLYVVVNEVVKRFLMCFGKPTIVKYKEYKFQIKGLKKFRFEEEITIKRRQSIEWGNWAKESLENMFILEALEDLKEGEEYPVIANVVKKETHFAPVYFNDAEFLSESQIVEMMAERGLGTKATRPAIYTMLSDRRYITTTPKMVLTTEIGNMIVSFLEKYCPALTDNKMTSEMEHDLNEVVKRRRQKDEVLEKGKGWLTEVFNQLFQNEEKIVTELAASFDECPKCGKFLVYKHYRGNTDMLFKGCVGYETDKCNVIASI